MVYNWGLWEDITDRFPVHSQSVDCLLPISDSVVCTGCMDGWVRYVGVHGKDTMNQCSQEFVVPCVCACIRPVCIPVRVSFRGGRGGGGIRPLLECVCPPLEIMWSYIFDNDAPPQHPESYICPPFGNFLNETLPVQARQVIGSGAIMSANSFIN